MKPVSVEFALPPLWRSRAALALSSALMVMAAVQGFGAWQHYVQAKGLTQRLEDISRETTLLQRNHQEQLQRNAPPYARDALTLAKKAKLPVNAALASLESVNVAGVSVKSFLADTDDFSIVVDVEYSGQEGLARYLSELARSSEKWQLLSAKSGVARLRFLAS